MKNNMKEKPRERFLRNTALGRLTENRLSGAIIREEEIKGSYSIAYPSFDGGGNIDKFNKFMADIAKNYLYFVEKKMRFTPSGEYTALLTFHVECNESNLTVFLRGFHGLRDDFSITSFRSITFSLPDFSIISERKVRKSMCY